MTKTADADRWDNARKVMAKEGVPATVIERVFALRPSAWIYQLSVWSYVALMVAGFAVGAVLWKFCERFIEGQARAVAAAAGGILFDHDFGLGFFILLFSWILISGLAISALFMQWPRARASLFVFTLLDPKNRYALTMGGRLKKLPEFSDPDEYLLAASRGMNSPFASIGAVLAAAGLTILVWELDTFTVYSPHGFAAKPLLPWEEVKRRDWSDADSVELGCNHIRGKNASDDIIYDVRFADGSSRRLSAAIPVDGDLLSALETIDQALREAKVEFERWRWLQRNPLHPACLAVQERRFSAGDFKRLKRILRVGEFPEDAITPTYSGP